MHGTANSVCLPCNGALQAVRTSSMRQNWLATTSLQTVCSQHTGHGPNNNTVQSDLLAVAQRSRATQARRHALRLPGALYLRAARCQNGLYKAACSLLSPVAPPKALEPGSKTMLSARY